MSKDSDKKLSTKKKWHPFRWFAGISILAILAGAAFKYDKETSNISQFINNLFRNKKPTDEIAEIADRLPIDNEGVIDITFPIVDRTLEEPNGRYSSIEGYDTYGIYTDEGKVELKRYTNTTNSAGGNVVDYQTVDGTKPIGVISVVDEYSGFLDYMKGVLDSVAKREATYTAKLKEEKYEVSDIYSLPEGYELYTEDASIRDKAQLVYVDSNGNKVYLIPAMYVSKFTGVQSEIYDYIVKYEGLREQIVFAYNTYNENARQFIGTIDEYIASLEDEHAETANNSR